ncbi:hypothetical protein [Actinomadura spongiicola]|uniref:hypothetical protein n=1 Tax=Actinomadura spongiicola TaxID=2303421 RepID=UPI0011C0FC72|nr:hypothetical protein [Actinomadura spongiicola]
MQNAAAAQIEGNPVESVVVTVRPSVLVVLPTGLVQVVAQRVLSVIGAGERDGEPEQTLSYHLRATLGARPQTAAAAATYAAALPPGAEAEQLNSLAAHTARELGLTWLLQSLGEPNRHPNPPRP